MTIGNDVNVFEMVMLNISTRSSSILNANNSIFSDNLRAQIWCSTMMIICILVIAVGVNLIQTF